MTSPAKEHEHREALILQNKAAELGQSGRYVEAAEKLKRALELYERCAPADAIFATMLLNMGLVHQHLGETEQALAHFTKAIKTYKSSPGSNRTDLADAVYQLGTLYSESCGKWNEAVQCLDESLEIRKEVLGNNHLDVGHALQAKGSALSKLKQYDGAIACFERSLAIRRQRYGNVPHLDIASVLHDIGTVYYKDSKCDKALEYCEEAMRLYTIVLGPESEKIAKVLFTVGSAYFGQERFSECLESWRKALRIQRSTLGNHKDTAKTLHFLGAVHEYLQHRVKAILCFEESLKMYRALGMDDEDCESVISNLRILRQPASIAAGAKLDLHLPSDE